jgi:Domain of unknown function (DUF4276)
MILPIVEGESEVESVPVLLRRLLHKLGRSEIGVARPFRVKRYQVVRPGELERALRQGLRDRHGVQAILVLLDADDDDPQRLEEELLARCRAETSVPTAVVVARRELEAWFLGCKDALRGICGIHPEANAPADPEAIRGAKERLTRNMQGQRRYLEVDDQPTLAAAMDFDLAARRCPSFDRLRSRLTSLLP